MAFRNKASVILKKKPDILVVPECENPGKLVFPKGTKKPNDALWFGNNPHKGLGIFSFNGYTLRLLDNHNPALQTIIPIDVTGAAFNFTLLAIWANNPTDPDGQYVEQVWKALHHYNKLLSNKLMVLAGDFNSNTIWDRKYRQGNHSHVVEWLEAKNIYSAYHIHHKQTQGKEKHSTFYLYRHKDKPYHIDYCFLSKDLAATLQSVEIGRHHYWKKYSDHMPLITTFNEAIV